MKVEILQQNGYNFMWMDGELWMWDIPAEVELQKDLAKQAFGQVLVAGYGLGIVQKFLDENEKVTGIDTVEKYVEVPQAYFDHFKEAIPGALLISDYYELSDRGKKWDCVIGDIWPEISSKHLGEYVKFKVKAEELVKDGGKVLGWGAEYYDYLLEMM